MGIRKSRALAVALGLGLCLALLGAAPALADTGIEGRVMEPTEAEGVHEVEVCAFAQPPLAPSEHCALSEFGPYLITGLEKGNYKVHFQPREGSEYLDQWYSHKSSLAAARPVEVAADEIKAHVDTVLDIGGSVSGLVTDTGGVPLDEISVCVFSLPRPELGSHCDETGLTGKYDIFGLHSGLYTASFSSADESRGIFPQYFGGAALPGEADDFLVLAFEETPGIDARMELGVAIEGQVVEAGSGLPLDGIRVCALSAATAAEVRCVTSRSDGRYEIFSLHRGEYVVGFSVARPGVLAGEDAFVRQYYEDKATFAEADRIDASGPGVFQDIDAHLTRGPEVFPGKVTAPAPVEARPAEAFVTPPKRCRKGFRKKLVKGTRRCVRVKHRKKGKRHGGRHGAHHPVKTR
jgi:hypothetical protein